MSGIGLGSAAVFVGAQASNWYIPPIFWDPLQREPVHSFYDEENPF